MSVILSTILSIIFILTCYPTLTNSECCTCTTATTSKATPGCSTDFTCETNVCNQDSFCCSYDWDSMCATSANNICVVTTSPTPSTQATCCQCKTAKPYPTPGCNVDTACETNVCGADSYCCNISWNSSCATSATNICDTATSTTTTTTSTTKMPTKYPTKHPTRRPTSVPTPAPTKNPTSSPTPAPIWTTTYTSTSAPTYDLKMSGEVVSILVIIVIVVFILLVIAGFRYYWYHAHTVAENPKITCDYDDKNLIVPSAPELVDNENVRGTINTFGESEGLIEGNEGHFSIVEWFKYDVALKEYNAKYIDLFVVNGFDNVRALMEMTDEDMRSIGINKLGHRKVMLTAIRNFKNPLND